MKAHIRTAPEKLLIFGTDSGKTVQLRQICSSLGIQALEISPGNLNETVGRLADLPADSISCKADTDGRENGRECVIFCNFSEKSLDKALESIRKNIPGGIPLKAVLTPTNRKMTLAALLSELEREHKLLSGREKGRQGG